MEFTRLGVSEEYRSKREELRLVELELTDHVERAAELRRQLPTDTVVDDYEFPFGSSPMVTKIDEVSGTSPWYMCNTNGPYFFSNLSSLAISNGDVWVASADGANYPDSRAARGSLTELRATDGGLVQTVP